MGRSDSIRDAILTDVQLPKNVAGAEMDIVYIQGLRGTTVIGIDTSELHEPQSVTLDLAIGVPHLRACVTDRIDDTVNYAAVRERIVRMLASHDAQLLEALAERIAQTVIAEFGAHWVRIALAKPAKFPDVEAVGVSIERRRTSGAHWGGTVLDLIGRGFVPKA